MINFFIRFLKTHLSRMDFNQKFFFHLWMCTSWLTARLEISTSFILFSIAILCVSLRSSISPVALGLALTYGLQLNALFQRVVQVTIDIISYMISTERVLEYCEIDSEPSTVAVTQDVQLINEKNPIPKGNDPGQQASLVDKKDKKELTSTGDSLKSRPGKGKGRNRNASTAEPLPPNWPSEGIVQFENVWMQYRDNPAVLKGISFKTQPAMRIGMQSHLSSLFHLFVLLLPPTALSSAFTVIEAECHLNNAPFILTL
jgi:ABC-type multidrug transport system fused ATPase/permease subunit